jgi:hypothetical protein
MEGRATAPLQNAYTSLCETHGRIMQSISGGLRVVLPDGGLVAPGFFGNNILRDTRWPSYRQKIEENIQKITSLSA